VADPVFDLIVIGSGPAGEQAALSAAKLGKRVAVIEREAAPGGARIHTGTIPSKTLRETAVYLAGFKQRSIYGVSYGLKKDIGIRELMYRKGLVVQAETGLLRSRFNRNDVVLLEGFAAFETPHRIRILRPDGTSSHFEAERIFIATGSHPVHPPGVPFDNQIILDSDSILRLDRIPRSLMVVGGGVIGCEYASIFASLGVAVTIIEGRDRLLRFADHEIADALASDFRRRGAFLRLNDTVQEIRTQDNRAVAVLKSGTETSTEKLLFAMGRTGSLAGMDIDKAGLTIEARGYLKVNQVYQTSQPHIYAVGDVIGFPSLASTSMEQGRIAALHAFGMLPTRSGIEPVLPYGIYTIPEISMIGLTEEQTKEQGIPYEIGVAHYFETARGQINGDTEGLLKLIFHRETRNLLGVHVFGEKASELVHIGQAVLAYGGALDYFIEAVFNYPTLSELYRIAALNGLNRLSHS
jgi:NAD(P) transhydrogenase